jgi:DNA repair exonuclease SbcCD ATPase subunit
MQETLIWALLLLTEAFLLTSGILGFLLWRARKAQRRLRAEMAELQRTGHQAMDTAESIAPEVLPPVAAPDIMADAELAEMDEAPHTTDDLNEVIALFDEHNNLDASMERLQDTNKSLHQLMDELQTERTLAQQDQHKLAVLRRTLQNMGQELESVRYAHTRMQRDLQNKKLILRRTMEESDQLYKQRVSLQHTVKELRSTTARLSSDLEVKERVLKQLKAETQAQQNLRGEVWTLQRKLTARDADVERLQTEKDTLTEELSALNKEYERMYENFLK